MAPVTADTNVYISALQFGGTPLQFLEQARAGVFRLAVSPPILTEVRRVLSTKFAWPASDIATAFSDLDECTTMVHPTRTLAVVVDDPDDDRILECAVEAGSRYLVSGDNHLLRLGRYENVHILRVAEFLGILGAE